MFPAPLPLLKPDEFSRCDERTQRSDLGKDTDPIQRSDASLKASVERALWNDEVLRAMDYYEIDVHAKNGIVYLNGHIANTGSRIRIENALRSVPGILGVRNHLILDEKLILEVAGALGSLEHTHGCKFFTGSSHGVISITGIVSNEKVKLLAEMCAAGNPNVRAVVNHVRVSGLAVPELQEPPLLQPIIGEKIYFLDGIWGVVDRVIINPNNRRVIAMLLLMNFSGLPKQLVHVPMDTVRYLTKISGFLLIHTNERNRYQDFDAASFFTPGADWTPPHPYCPRDVLFPVADPEVDAPTPDTEALHPFAFEELLEGASVREPSLAGDAPGSSAGFALAGDEK